MDEQTRLNPDLPERVVELRLPSGLSIDEGGGGDGGPGGPGDDDDLVLSSVPPFGVKRTRESPAQRRERARTWIGGGVVGGWVLGAIGTGTSIIADWVTWEEIDDLAGTFTNVTIAVIAFYFGTQSKDD